MTNTPNLGLHTWAPEDPVNVAEVNENFSLLDQNSTSLSQSLSALTAAVGTGGYTCRIASGSYIGSGLAGQSHPNTLTFAFKPMVLMVSDQDSVDAPFSSVVFRGMDQGSIDNAYGCLFTWGSNSVSWYSPYNNGTGSTSQQASMSGHHYTYLVLGYDQ